MEVQSLWNHLTQSQPWLSFSAPNDRSFALEVVKTLATIFGGLAVYLNFYLSRKNTKIAQDNTRIAESRLITERFSKAVEQLSHENITVRLGGIYTLEKIAKESPDDYHWTVMEVLTSFLRMNTSSKKRKSNSFFQEAASQPELPKEPLKPAADIQAILNVIGQRTHEQRQVEERPLDLCGVNIRGADLKRAYLEGVLFIAANLESANLSYAHLEGADLSKANLDNTNLYSAHLENANLSNARLENAEGLHAVLNKAFLYDVNLEQANLMKAHLKGAQLCRARLNGAQLCDAHMEEADFTEAHLEDVLLVVPQINVG